MVMGSALQDIAKSLEILFFICSCVNESSAVQRHLYRMWWEEFQLLVLVIYKKSTNKNLQISK